MAIWWWYNRSNKQWRITRQGNWKMQCALCKDAEEYPRGWQGLWEVSTCWKAWNLFNSKKYSATVARKSGVSKDNLDYQARWKSKRMQDNYVRMELSWPDIACASNLCKCSFIIYKAKDDLGLTNDWGSRFIAPATTAAFDEGVGAILGCTLLWACMDPIAAEARSSFRWFKIDRFVTFVCRSYSFFLTNFS